MQSSIDQLVGVLLQALREPLRRKEIVADFQAIVWEGLDPTIPKNVRDTLRELAYDLNFFEVRSKIRTEDNLLYGHKQLEDEIREGLNKLRQLGLSIPNE